MRKVTLTDYRELANKLMANLINTQSLYPGSWWLGALKRFLNKEDPWDVGLWGTWKTVDYGGEEFDVKKLKTMYRKSPAHFDSYVFYLIKALAISPKVRRAKLLVAPVKMLGFKGPATIQEINKALLAMGFSLLTDELAVNFFLEIKPKEPIYIAMEPFVMKDLQSFTLAALSGSLATRPTDFRLSLDYNVVFEKKS